MADASGGQHAVTGIRPHGERKFRADPAVRGFGMDFGSGVGAQVDANVAQHAVLDRNPQTYVDNIYKASAADYQPATQKIFRKSYIQLPVMER